MFSVNPFSKKPFSNGSGNPAITYGYNINNYNNPFGNPSTSLGLEGSVTLPNYQDFADEIINSITNLASRSERDNPTIYQSGNVGGNDNKILGPISSDRAKEIADLTQNLIKETFSKNQNNSIKPSFFDKFSNSTFGKDFNKWSQGLNIANNLFTTFAGEKSEYSGTKRGLVRGIDSVYDTVQSASAMFGPAGQFASLIMGGNKLLGNIANKLGAGTSGNTPIDAILNSSFLQLTPLGLINGFGGKKTMSFTKDNLAFAQVGSGYIGTNTKVDKALALADKKFGLLSPGALDEANDKIIDAGGEQRIMANVADTASDRFALSDSMAAINNSRMALNLMGDYDQSSVRLGKAGMILQLAREINSKSSVLKEITEIPEEFLEVTEFKEGGVIPVKTRTIDELIEYAKQKNPRFIQRMSEPIRYVDLGNGYRGTHKLSWSTTDNPNEAVVYPKIFENDKGELIYDPKRAWDNAKKGDALLMTPEEAELFTKQYKKGWPNFFNKFQKGGQIISQSILQEVAEIPVEFLEIDEFKKGGKFNIIPEGALHARKHNMDVENITQKGIPVVSESADGEIVQQAEIERQEIIFRLEVTKKLEELAKDGSDEAAIEAGKLLVQEILYNTIDNTNTLL